MKLISKIILKTYKIFDRKNLIRRVSGLMMFIAFAFTLYGQNEPNNLEKYWYYRERLKRFVVTTNYTDPGTNIPAQRINGNEIGWDDGNGMLNQYISMLATEYRLLRDYDQDVSQTAKDLFYALKSFERLDKTAESYYGGQPNDLNGFFVRDDITDEFWSIYGPGGSNPYFQASGFGFETDPYDKPAEESQDNIWHILESFALVNALVEKEVVDGVEINFKKIATDNVKRIVQRIIHTTYFHFISWTIVPPLYIKNDLAHLWYLKNPETDEFVSEGSGIDGGMHITSFGFAMAHNFITGTSNNSYYDFSVPLFKYSLSCPLTDITYKLFVYNRIIPVIFTGYIDVELALTGPGYYQAIFDFVSNPPLYETIDSWSKELYHFSKDDYCLRSLCATGNISDANGISPYEVLIRKQHENEILKYEHLPLIWSVINNDYSKISSEDISDILNLLNCAPTCGPNKIWDGGLVARNDNWSSVSRLVWPERSMPLNDGRIGEYNGLDYMLLHNLFWLTNAPVDNIPNYYPGIPYGQTPSAKNQIVCSQTIDLSDKNIILSAGESILLNLGFETTGNGIFEANVVEITPDNMPVYFKKVSIDDYPLCP